MPALPGAGGTPALRRQTRRERQRAFRAIQDVEVITRRAVGEQPANLRQRPVDPRVRKARRSRARKARRSRVRKARRSPVRKVRSWRAAARTRSSTAYGSSKTSKAVGTFLVSRRSSTDSTSATKRHILCPSCASSWLLLELIEQLVVRKSMRLDRRRGDDSQP
jgi:hypothetical protein